MCEIYILVYVETTLLIVGSSIAAVSPLFKHLNCRLRGAGTSGNDDTASRGNAATPLRTFGQWTSRQRLQKNAGQDDDDDDETTLTRGDAARGGSRTSLEGIVKTTDVQQTWGPADAELEPKSAERKLGLARGMF